MQYENNPFNANHIPVVNFQIVFAENKNIVYERYICNKNIYNSKRQENFNKFCKKNLLLSATFFSYLELQ